MLANFVVSLSFSLPSVLQPLLLLQPSIIEAPIGGALGSLYQVPDQSLHCCERKEEAYFFSRVRFSPNWCICRRTEKKWQSFFLNLKMYNDSSSIKKKIKKKHFVLLKCCFLAKYFFPVIYFLSLNIIFL